jgi:hypothetical protein
VLVSEAFWKVFFPRHASSQSILIASQSITKIMAGTFTTEDEILAIWSTLSYILVLWVPLGVSEPCYA